MKAFTFASKSSPGTSYEVQVGHDGKMTCNCRGWVTKRVGKPRECTHTKKVASSAATKVIGDYVYLEGEATEQSPVEPDVGNDVAPPVPMLAKAMTEPLSGAAFDEFFGDGQWMMEEKLDGHRLIAVVSDNGVIAYARPRAGTTVGLVRPLPPRMVDVLFSMPRGIYDGELIDCNSSKSWNVSGIDADLQFALFDVLKSGDRWVMDLPYEERRGLLEDVAPDGDVFAVGVMTPSWTIVEGFWRDDREGVILKRRGSLYNPGSRSSDWIKVKKKLAASLTVIGFLDGKNDSNARVILQGDDGKETTVKARTAGLVRLIQADPDSFIGRRVVISYQERTPDGSYRHPVFDHFEEMVGKA